MYRIRNCERHGFRCTSLKRVQSAFFVDRLSQPHPLPQSARGARLPACDPLIWSLGEESTPPTGEYSVTLAGIHMPKTGEYQIS